MEAAAVNDVSSLDPELPFAGNLSVSKMPAHWLMARLGKRVLRPGGLEATRWLIKRAGIGSSDDVIELAPGMGRTARELLGFKPRSYAGVDRDEGAADFAKRALRKAGFGDVKIYKSDASSIPVESGSASVVFGEAMLSMQRQEKKRAIIAEAARVLRSGGRYAIHELAVAVERDADTKALIEEIQKDLSTTIHVGVRIGTVAEWRALLSEAGLEVESEKELPMKLLELDRLIQDEGILGTLRFIFNMLRTPGATERLLSVRRSFKKHNKHLIAIAMVAKKP